MRNKALGAVGLAVAAALLLWWWQTRNADEPAPVPATARPAQPERPVAPVPAIPSPGAATEQTAPARGPVPLVAARVEDDPSLPSGEFSGRVINWGSMRPVAGAEVTFSWASASASARTDAAGAFRFVPPEPGAYRLAVVDAEGYLPYAPDWGHSPIAVTASPGKRVTGITLYLTPAIDYTGVVVTAAGEPVAGARVRLLDARVGEQALMPIDDTFTSDARGEFVFHAPDDAVLEASHPEHGLGRAAVDLGVQGSHRVTIALVPGATPAELAIVGQVVDTAGAPIGGARVRAQPSWLAQRDRPAPMLEAITADDGRFRLDGADAGMYMLSARADGYAPESLAAMGGDDDVRLQLSATAVIHGRVVTGATREPVAAFTVVALVAEGLRRHVVANESVMDGDGRFALEVPPGAYVVVARAAGFAISQEVAATAEVPPERAPDITIALPAGGTLIGRVVDADTAAPLESARVSAEGLIGSGSSALPMVASTVTAADGSFELPGLSPGVTSVNVAAHAHDVRIVGGIEVVDGAVIGPITVELTPTAEGEQPKLELAGIGVAIGAGDDGLVVQQVFPAGGAADAGLVEGDTILAVGGTAVIDLGFEPALQRIRGPVGTRVTLRVRKTDGSELELAVTRKKIRA